MIQRAAMFAVSIILLAVSATAPAVAQEDSDGVQLHLELHCDGETLEEFTVQVTQHGALDQSSAKGCIQSFLTVLDASRDMMRERKNLETLASVIVHHELSDDMNAILQPALISKREPNDEPPRRPPYWQDANWQLDAEWQIHEYTYGGVSPNARTWKQVKEGDKTFLVYRTTKRKDSNVVFVSGYAFLTRKAQGIQWRIAHMLTFWEQVDADRPVEEQLTPNRWYMHDYHLPMAIEPNWKYEQEEPDDADSELSTGVSSFFDILRERGRIRTELFRRVQRAWFEALQPLLLPGWIAELEDASADRFEAHIVSHELQEIREDENSVIVKLADFFKTEWRFRFEQTDDGLRISALDRRYTAIRKRDNEEVEWFKEVEEFWSVDRNRVATAWDLQFHLQ